jgi:anti-sigma-K factor RskA
MKPEAIQELRDTLLRRELNPDEERVVAQWLARNPGEVEGWRAELMLARSVRRLPDVPVSSNFTAQVLRQIGREEPGTVSRRSRRSGFWGWLGTWRWPAVGVAAAVAVVAVTFWQIETTRSQAELNRQIAALRTMSDLPPAVLEDFEAIRSYGESSAPVDFGLLAALE